MTNAARFPSPPLIGGERARPVALGDELALDFLNSVATPQAETYDWIRSGDELLEWLLEFGALTSQDIEDVRKQWSPADIDAVADRAIAWREAFRALMFRIGSEGAGTIGVAEIEAVNAWLRSERGYVALEAHEDGGFSLEKHRHWHDPDQLMAPVALSAASMIESGDWSLIRKCENPACSIWFRDRTKGHRRRWCSQALCGNRFKVAAFRGRQKMQG